jgi:hypothetical protein
MKSTPLAQQAQRLVIYANGLRARRRKSAPKRREAQLAVARAILAELRKAGSHFPRSVDRALRT